MKKLDGISHGPSTWQKPFSGLRPPDVLNSSLEHFCSTLQRRLRPLPRTVGPMISGQVIWNKSSVSSFGLNLLIPNHGLLLCVRLASFHSVTQLPTLPFLFFLLQGSTLTCLSLTSKSSSSYYLVFLPFPDTWSVYPRYPLAVLFEQAWATLPDHGRRDTLK